MKRYKNYILFLLCPLFGLTGCQKEDLVTYEGIDMINFDYASMDLKKDSVTVAYGFVEDQYKDIDLKLLLIGYAKPVEREIKLTVTSEDMAQAGVHYVLPEKIVLPANEMSVTVPLKILRPADLMKSAKSFLIRIEDSEDIAAGIRTTLFVAVSDEIPDEWIGGEGWIMNKPENYFGECSKTKYLFVYQQVGVWDFSVWNMMGFMGDAAKFIPAKRIVKEKLAEYNAAHPNEPLTDPDKGPVTFPD